MALRAPAIIGARLFCMGSPQIRTERIFSWSQIIYLGHIRHFNKLYYSTALFEHEPNPILFELYFAFRQFMNKRMNILPLFSFFLITAVCWGQSVAGDVQIPASINGATIYLDG